VSLSCWRKGEPLHLTLLIDEPAIGGCLPQIDAIEAVLSGESVRAGYVLNPGLLRFYNSRKKRHPTASDEQLETLIAGILGEDLHHRRHSRRIRTRQARLKRRVSEPAWKLYLLLEEAEVERLTYALDRLAERALSTRRKPR
jgi:hypothetical protein